MQRKRLPAVVISSLRPGAVSCTCAETTATCSAASVGRATRRLLRRFRVQVLPPGSGGAARTAETFRARRFCRRWLEELIRLEELVRQTDTHNAVLSWPRRRSTAKLPPVRWGVAACRDSSGRPACPFGSALGSTLRPPDTSALPSPLPVGSWRHAIG